MKKVRFVEARRLGEHAVAAHFSFRGRRFWVPHNRILSWEQTERRTITPRKGGMKTPQGVRDLARQSIHYFLDPGQPGILEIPYDYAKKTGLDQLPGVEFD